DLYYRIAVVRVQLPPLRHRKEDIGLLVHAFLERFAPGTTDLSDEFLRALSHRPWPGNVRELRNAVERAVALTAEQVPSSAVPREAPRPRDEMSALFSLPIKDAIGQWVERLERAYVEHALLLSGGNVTAAARVAGVNRRYIQRLMRRHGMGEEPP